MKRAVLTGVPRSDGMLSLLWDEEEGEMLWVLVGMLLSGIPGVTL